MIIISASQKSLKDTAPFPPQVIFQDVPATNFAGPPSFFISHQHHAVVLGL